MLPPGVHYPGVDYYCKDKVEKYSSKNYKESLPRRFAAVFPRLRLFGHGLLVHGFIYHSRYLAVATQRKPSYTVFGITVFWLVFEKAEPWVKEKIEFLNPYLEYSCKKEVPELMDKYQYAQGQYELQYLY